MNDTLVKELSLLDHTAGIHCCCVIDGSAGLLTETSRKASVRGPLLALAAVTVVVVLDENRANLFDIVHSFCKGLWL